MKAIRWMFAGIVATALVVTVSIAKAAPPGYLTVQGTKTNTLYWGASDCPSGTVCRPFSYVLYSNNVEFAQTAETVTNLVVAPAPVGIIEYAVAARNEAGQSEAATAVTTNAPPKVRPNKPWWMWWK